MFILTIYIPSMNLIYVQPRISNLSTLKQDHIAAIKAKFDQTWSECWYLLTVEIIPN